MSEWMLDLKNAAKESFQAMQSSMSDFLSAVIRQTKTLKEAFRELVTSMAKMFIDEITKMIVKWIFFQALTGLGGMAGMNMGVGSTFNQITGFTKPAKTSTAAGGGFVPKPRAESVSAGGGGQSMQMTIQNHITPEVYARMLMEVAPRNTLINIINDDTMNNGIMRRTIRNEF